MVEFIDENQKVFFKSSNLGLGILDQKSDSVLNIWRNSGYMAASLDSTSTLNQKVNYHFYRGNEYNFEQCKLDSISRFVTELGIRPISKKKLGLNDLQQYFSTILKAAEETGYPFAKVGLKNIKFEGTSIQSDLHLELNQRILFDSLIVVGDVKVKHSMLKNLLSIRKGSVYKESSIRNIQKKLNEVPYLKMVRKPEFVFKKGLVDTYIYLESKGANRFSGIIGLLPNSIDGQTNITGDIDLTLINTLKLGERFAFEWQRIRPEVQDLSGSLNLPFLFDTPFGANASLQIFRQDSTLLEVRSNLGLLYNFGSQDFFRVYYSAFSSDRLENTQQAVDLGGSDYDSYGIGVVLSELDYVYNPRKGYSINVQADVGTRNFRPPTDVDSVTAEIPLKSDVINIAANLSYFIPSGKKSAFVLQLNAESKLNPYLLSNELIRFGGNSSLRGFDEESLRKTSYAFLNMEYKIITDLNSNIFLFSNLAWTETNLVNSYSNDFPYGFGAGANFDTKAGIFSLSYALGAQNDNPIRMNQAKVHFGFKSLF